MKIFSIPCNPLDVANDSDSLGRFGEICRYLREVEQFTILHCVETKVVRHENDFTLCILGDSSLYELAYDIRSHGTGLIRFTDPIIVIDVAMWDDEPLLEETRQVIRREYGVYS